MYVMIKGALNSPLKGRISVTASCHCWLDVCMPLFLLSVVIVLILLHSISLLYLMLHSFSLWYFSKVIFPYVSMYVYSYVNVCVSRSLIFAVAVISLWIWCNHRIMYKFSFHFPSSNVQFKSKSQKQLNK